ncbi:MAG: glycogen synthase GlgA [Nitrosomonas sp.]|nr:glycogen synthase GlgA [Nitrosomonas sp.]
MNASSLRRKLRALFITSEIFPLCKTGGLGDVSAALPAALRGLNIDIRILLPGYPSVLSGLKYKRKLAEFNLSPHFPVATLIASRLKVHANDYVPIYVIDCPALYQREGGPYSDAAGQNWPDNAQRFGLLSKIGALLASDASPLTWVPEIVHCNDWQSGLTPAYLHFYNGKKAASMMTLHNLAFQGCFPLGEAHKLELPPESVDIHGLEYYGNVSFIKAGIFYADYITTVSPSYAEEIQHETLGFGLQGLLAERRDHLSGILNGIDATVWNPQTDPHLYKNYSIRTLTNKSANKLALQQSLGLEANISIPLFAAISRISHQKGYDLLLQIAPMLVKLSAQLVVLGSGSVAMENQLTALQHAFPKNIVVKIGYDESLSHQIEAGADCFLMPSRFEPCGLNQMYSQHYGTLPLVHATGGLQDTVVDVTTKTIANETASGFVFDTATPESFLAAIERALSAYGNHKLWRSLQRNAMRKDFGWKTSALAYRSIYQLIRPA